MFLECGVASCSAVKCVVCDWAGGLKGLPRAFQLGKLSCMLVWINSVCTFVWLSIQSIICSILDVLCITASIINNYSAWKGKVLLNKWLMTILKSNNANWTWQWKYYQWFTFFYLVNTYSQMWPFLFILYRPLHLSFSCILRFFFGG
jgi:hypothetical protein